MHAVTALSLLALAGSALALPAPHRKQGGNNVHIVYETKVYTVVVTPGQAQPTVPPQAQPKPAEPTTTTVVQQEKPTSYYVAPAPTTPTSSAAPAATKPATEPATDSGYMGVVNQWRQKLGLATLAHSDTLEANARKTCDDGNGVMKHELNPGTNAQVLAPGGPKDFTKVFVGGWLCEKPNMAGMDGICDSMSSGWDYAGQTGHADILSSGSYTKIGCANVEGIWGCDLTF